MRRAFVASAARLAGAAVLVCLAGCANRSLPPTLTLEGNACAAQPDLAGATPLPLDPDKPVTVTVDAAASCLQPDKGEKRSYATFLLPETAAPYLVSVTSSLRGRTLLSPRLLILDAQGHVLRERSRETFTFRGTSLYAGMRAYPGDRYLIVESDPETVGQQVTQINSNSQTNAVATGAGGVLFWGAGADARQSFTYTHNGTLVVTARPLPPTN
jgi:hypothetical protein